MPTTSGEDLATMARSVRDALPEPAADPLADTRCTSCGALPHLVVGLPVFVTFTAEGVATVGVDTSELGDVRRDEVDWNHAEDCPGMDEATTFARCAAVAKVAERVALVAAPSVDVTL